MFVEIIMLTPTVNVIEIGWLIINLYGFVMTLINHYKETLARKLLVQFNKDTLDNMKAANENIRRQRYKVVPQGVMLGLIIFACTQVQPPAYTLQGFFIHLVFIYLVLVLALDSFKDSLYQKKFRAEAGVD